ncbi:MAG: hypothetical protein ACREHG_11220, partial [Candidatus Saccharimonadales bacterium]
MTNAKRRAGIDNEEEMAQIAGNDDLSEAATATGGNLSRMQDHLNKTGKYSQSQVADMVGAYEISRKRLAKKGYSEDAINQGIFLNGLKARTAHTGAEDWDGDTYVGAARVMEDIERLSKGNLNTKAQLIAKSDEITSASGRPNLVPGFSDSLTAAEMLTKASGGTEDERRAARKNVADFLAAKTIYKQGAQAFMGGNAHATRQMVGAYQSTISRAVSDYETVRGGGTVEVEG